MRLAIGKAAHSVGHRRLVFTHDKITGIDGLGTLRLADSAAERIIEKQKAPIAVCQSASPAAVLP